MISGTGLLKTNLMETLEKENKDAEDIRLRDLKRRFNDLGATVEKAKVEKQSVQEENIHTIKRMIDEIENDQTLKLHKNTICGLIDKLELFKNDKEEFESAISKKLRNIQEEFRLNLDGIRSDNKSLISEFSKQGSDRLFSLGLNLKKTQKQFSDEAENIKINFEDRIEVFREQIEKENQDLAERTERIEIKVLSELDKIEEEIVLDKRVREETNDKIQNLIREMNVELSKKIEREKNEREQSNNSLLVLLEEACSRIERNFSNSYN